MPNPNIKHCALTITKAWVEYHPDLYLFRKTVVGDKESCLQTYYGTKGVISTYKIYIEDKIH